MRRAVDVVGVRGADTVSGSPCVSGVSVPASAPVSGLSRKFWPVLLTTRMRSTVGLKSKPNSVPLSAGAKAAAPTCVATPVAVFS